MLLLASRFLMTTSKYLRGRTMALIICNHMMPPRPKAVAVRMGGGGVEERTRGVSMGGGDGEGGGDDWQLATGISTGDR